MYSPALPGPFAPSVSTLEERSRKRRGTKCTAHGTHGRPAAILCFMNYVRVTHLGAVSLLLLLGACGPTSDLFIETVVPADSATGLETTLIVHGEQFQPNARIHLEHGGSTSVVVLPSHVNEDGTTAAALVPSGMEAGTYDVTLVNKGGTSRTHQHAFTLYDGGVEITFLDVGQGDSTFVRSPRGDSLLKDAGTPEAGETAVIPFLSRLGALPPTHIITSHRHNDHMGGVVEILEGPNGEPGTSNDHHPHGLLLHNRDSPPCDTLICKRYEAAAGVAGARPAELGETISLGAGVEVEVVAVNGALLGGITLDPGDEESLEGENASSVAVVITFGDLRVFVGGDLTGGGNETVDMETPLSAAIAPIHVLRVNHHGSATSTNESFLHNLEPAASVVSAGLDNPHCHPHRSVMKRLQSVGAHIFLTTPGIVDAVATGCGEPTFMPPGAVPEHGHIRMESTDGRSYQIGPLEGELIELWVE